jgi:hypothetical protein
VLERRRADETGGPFRVRPNEREQPLRAERAHNPKVAGSNPAPATTRNHRKCGDFLISVRAWDSAHGHQLGIICRSKRHRERSGLFSSRGSRPTCGWRTPRSKAYRLAPLCKATSRLSFGWGPKGRWFKSSRADSKEPGREAENAAQRPGSESQGLRGARRDPDDAPSAGVGIDGCRDCCGCTVSWTGLASPRSTPCTPRRSHRSGG